MAKQTIKIATNKLLDALKNQQLWNKLGLAAIRLIRIRTRKGKDVDGKDFKKYSAGYKKKREKAGLPTHPVNLEFANVGSMLHKIDHVIYNEFDGVSVLIDDPHKEQIARYHNIEGAGKSKVIRKFWGINKEEEDKLVDIAAREVENIIKKL